MGLAGAMPCLALFLEDNSGQLGSIVAALPLVGKYLTFEENGNRGNGETSPGWARGEWAGRRDSACHVCRTDGPALDSFGSFLIKEK